ncbi:hypothetical protein D6D05_02630, partial [Aureobasidium pullulans]
RYLAQVNNIISVGEALVQTDQVSESGINFLRKALDSVYDALQDNAIELGAPSTASDVAKIVTTIRKKQKTESGAKATKNDGDTEDEESETEVEEESIETTKRKFRGDTKCLLEKATVWPPTTDNDWATKLANYMRSVGDGVTSVPSKALQELLLLIWSGQGIDNVQSLAHQTRENAATIQSTQALNVVGKERTASDFSDMASISARSGSLFEAYREATSVEGHLYGKEGTKDSYRLFVIEKAIPVVYEEHEDAARDRVEADQKYGNKARTTIDNALKVGQVL